MSTKKDDYFEKLFDKLSNISHINPKDLPEIELYMDQVTTFMDTKLDFTKRYDTDKILTKTMINNYAKNDLLPPPVKKKYSKEHMLMLIYIYYLKNILAINDIRNLLNPISERYFDNPGNINMDRIYKEVYENEKSHLDDLINNLRDKYEFSKGTFEDASEEDKEFLQSFSFICSLAFDVYVKKHIIEHVIDNYSNQHNKSDNKNNTDKKSNDKNKKKK